MLEILLNQSSIPQNMVELQDLIGQLEDIQPDKRTKLYKRWVERINKLRREYNRKSASQIYVYEK